MPQFYQTYLLYSYEFLKIKLILCKISELIHFIILVLLHSLGFNKTSTLWQCNRQKCLSLLCPDKIRCWANGICLSLSELFRLTEEKPLELAVSNCFFSLQFISSSWLPFSDKNKSAMSGQDFEAFLFALGCFSCNSHEWHIQDAEPHHELHSDTYLLFTFKVVLSV